MTCPFAQLLLNWYRQHARTLPWRSSRDPYAIWVSEIMLQQTQVDTVIPYYTRWMQRFPTIKTLADAEEQAVLKVWEGLGYYSRARNLHKAAMLVMSDYNGVLPDQAPDLEKLPGIGPYTAGAIASIAFGRNAAALDGNIKRVYARLFAVEEPINSPAGIKQLDHLAQQALPSGDAGDYNQALMDLGSSICTARNPACGSCPISSCCEAFRTGQQNTLPVKNARPRIPHYTVTAAVIAKDQKVLLARRPDTGMLAGLWEYPGGKLEKGEDLHTCLKREILEELGVEIEPNGRIGLYRHAYTHFKVTLYAFHAVIKNGGVPMPLEASELYWARIEELPSFPMAKIDRLISNDLADGRTYEALG